jgi:hypothetical protein
MLIDAAWEADEWGMSGTDIYRVGQPYLKILPYSIGFSQEQRVLAAEAARCNGSPSVCLSPKCSIMGTMSSMSFS